MAQATVIFGKDFSGFRDAIPVTPVNYVPPFTDGLHLYMPPKYDDTAGSWVNPWDLASDFTQAATFGKPTKITGSAVMGLKPILSFALLPTPRIVMTSQLGININKFSLHAVYTIPATNASNNRRAIFSILNADATQSFTWRVSGAPTVAAPSVGGPGQITVITGNLTPLAAKPSDAVQTDFEITNYTPVAATKVAMSLVYDGTVGGGTVYIYQNGVLKQTIPSVGALTLNGTAYIGAEVQSATAASDFKGELGYFIIDETARNITDVAAFHTYLNALFL